MTTSATVALRPVNAPIIPNLLPVGARKNKVGGQTWVEFEDSQYSDNARALC
jgi:hypothetical protein